MNVSWSALLVLCGVLIAIVLILFWHPQRSRTKTRASVAHGRTDAIFRDDERYWYGGVFYNNPDDPAVFVPKRFGLGWTMNFGRPQSRLILIGIALLVLLPPLVVAIIGILFLVASTHLDATRLDAPRCHKKWTEELKRNHTA